MSQRLIARSPDLKRLRDEGYNINVVDGYLIVRDIPYVNGQRIVKRGVLIMPLTLANDVAQQPADHQAQFSGETPCRADGGPVTGLAPSPSQAKAGDIVANLNFSAAPLPARKYKDYYHKVTSYVRRLADPAGEIEKGVTARTHPYMAEDDPESVFQYVDTATSRAEIVAASRKLQLGAIAILGLGGTGGYILDLVAKTPVRQIHLFDGDVFDQHNAFRAPGAASGEDLSAKLFKVHYFKRIYSRMHKGIVAHPEYISSENVAQLDAMSFVFISMEAGAAKRAVLERLLARGIPFVDVGMGIYLAGEQLGGTLRVTTATPSKNDHLPARMPLSDGSIKNEYDKNIQVADLNLINAGLAVLRWKKLFGFYADQGGEHYSTFAIGRNETNNEDLE